MQKTGRLELTWVGKYEERKIEPRILVEDKRVSHMAIRRAKICLFMGIIL